MMFSQNEILLMIGVVSVLLFCITILTILDIREYLKSKKGVIVSNTSFGEEYQEEEKLEPINVSLVEEKDKDLVVETEEIKPDEIYLEELEDESVEIKPEINPIIEESEEVFVPKVEEAKVEVEIPQIEVKEEKKKLDAFLEYEEIENNLPNEKDDVTNFEAEQERTAIISLDELMKKSNELYNDNEVVQYDDGNEPISIDEVIKMFKKDVDEVQETASEVREVPKVFQEIVDEKVPYSKKETIPFISSIYGIEKENNALEFENTATYEKLDREKYNDFVAQLQEMNENK